MPENIRSLIVILIIALFGFAFAKKAVSGVVSDSTYNQWRKIWLLLTISAFTIPGYWLFMAIGAILIYKFTKPIENKVALYFILLFIAPPIHMEIPGFGIINYFFIFSYPRLVSLTVLLPAAIAISKQNEFKFGKSWTDKVILLFMLQFFLMISFDASITDGMRKAFYMFLDVFLPYYVASRGIKNMEQLRTVFVAFIIPALILSIIGILENGKSWLLYNSVYDHLGVEYDISHYIGRMGGIRAVTSFDISIIFGYFLAVAMGFYLVIYPSIQSKIIKYLGFLILSLGLVSSLSRGPWVGATVLFIVYTLQGKNKFKKISILALLGMTLLAALLTVPGGQKYLNLLPFIGTTESENVEYREKLFDNAIIVINRNPFLGTLGSDKYLQEPEMQELRQGQNIIDIVNSYILVALISGYIGLSLFVSAFVSVIAGIISYKRYIKNKSVELHNIGSALVSILISIMLMIATASSIGAIPLIYLTVMGLGVAYTQVVINHIKENLNEHS